MTRKRGALGVCLAILAGGAAAQAQTVVRGPYLQQGNESGVVVRWRTSSAVDSRVRYGTTQGNLDRAADVAGTRTNHEVRLTGLSPETRYYYSVGTSTQTLAGGDAGHYFRTSPPPGAARTARLWVLGDAGTANSSQRAVRDAYTAFAGTSHTDLWLMLGDNAYDDGTDAEYQAAVFDMYKPMLAKSVLWSTFGNHDGHSADSSTQSGPYYDLFTFPKNGECGGLASGTEAYYSFDWGNVHFMCLDSYETSRSVGGAMETWARNDAAATTREWIIAFWHHPPYTKGSHDSDSEGALVDMRRNFLPVLEAAGVDLVLCGHSHSYERSFLIDGHYGASGSFTNAMKKDGGSGRDPNPYRKSAGTVAHEGAVYVVAGSSGKIGGGSLDHPAMFVSLNQLGSLVLDVSGSRIDARFLRENGTVADSFALVKGSPPPPGGDTTKPTVVVTQPTNQPTWTSTSNLVALGGTASDDVGVTQVTWSNAATGGTGTASGTTAWSASVPLAPGANAVTVTARDAAGNTATDVITVAYAPPSGDTTPPAIGIQTPTRAPSMSVSSEPVLVGGTASDGVGVVSVTWANAATGDTGTASGTTSWSVSIDLAAGPNLITVTARDAAGNATSASVTLIYAGSPAGGGAGAGTEGLMGDHCSLGTARSGPSLGWLAGLVFLAVGAGGRRGRARR